MQFFFYRRCVSLFEVFRRRSSSRDLTVHAVVAAHACSGRGLLQLVFAGLFESDGECRVSVCVVFGSVRDCCVGPRVAT